MLDNPTKKNRKEVKNYELLYSPRTKYSNQLDYEEKLFKDLTLNFDPITIKIIKKHFKERLGSLNKDEFISILKNHLLSWHPELPNRETVLIKFLGRLFSEIDLNDNGSLEWAEFTNYIIHNSNGLNKSNNKKNNPSYRLRYYYPVKNFNIQSDLKEIISYAFYIEKLNLIGLVNEGKPVINFYEGNTFQKIKTNIDLRSIQDEIDILEIRELDIRASELYKKEVKEREEKLNMQRITHQHSNTLYEPIKTIYNVKRKYKRDWITSKTKSRNLNQNSLTDNGDFQIDANLNKTKSIFGIKKLKLKNYDDYKLDTVDFTVVNKKKEFKKNTKKKLTIVSTHYINDFDILLVAGTNNKICTWKFDGCEFKNVNNRTKDYSLDKNFFNCSILIADAPQNTMVWDPLQKNLFSGQQDGKILKWDLTKSKSLPGEDLDFKKAKDKKREILKSHKLLDSLGGVGIEKSSEKIYFDRKTKTPIKIPGRENIIIDNSKSDSVSSLILLDKLQLLAASYLNGHIVLWDPLLKDFRKYYFDQSTGVYSMSYDQNKNLLITAGFNHDIYIYDPYIDNTAIYKLIGHNWSIISVTCNEKESEIISMDILGNIKLWDSQNLLNFQTINLNENLEFKKTNENVNAKKLSSDVKMIYMTKNKKILVYGKKLMLFETDRAQNPDLADDHLILACYYEKITKTILSFCLRKIKIWNIFTGKLKNVYEDPMNNEITAMAIDKNNKRAFLGDNTGKIKNFNMKNGKFLKELDSHNNEIRILLHSLQLNIVVSCSMDNIIKIHDDTELTESEVKKVLDLSPLTVTALEICEKHSRLVIGLSNGKIRFYDIEHFRYDSDSSTPITEASNNPDEKEVFDEVTCITQIEETEFIFAGYGSGKCFFIAGPPSPMKFTNLISFVNEGITPKSTNFPVCSAVVDYENLRLYTGDFIGSIRCYSLKKFYEMIEYAKTKVKNESDCLYSLEVGEVYKEIGIDFIWRADAKESIKHLHYVDEEPNILIVTSNDLKVKLYDAETGQYYDELKQVSCKYKPVPIGIKYLISDPFVPKDEQVYEEHIIKRNELIGYNNMLEQNQNYESQKINEYSKKIIEINAKEKLWEQIRGFKLKENQSNDWDLKIDIEKVKENEKNALDIILRNVKAKEPLIVSTEMQMQTKSLYSEEYKPEFINEMDEDQLHDFSAMLSQKMRQVKLAISKANLSQSKIDDFEKERKRKEQQSKDLHELMFKKRTPLLKIKLPVIEDENYQSEHEEEENENQDNPNINDDLKTLINNEQNESNLIKKELILDKTPLDKSIHKVIDNESLNKNEVINSSNNGKAENLFKLDESIHNSAIDNSNTYSNMVNKTEPTYTKSRFCTNFTNNMGNEKAGHDDAFRKTLYPIRKKLYLKPVKINSPMEINFVKSQYAFHTNRLKTVEDNFKKLNDDFEYDCNEAIKAAHQLGKKTRIKLRSKGKIKCNLMNTNFIFLRKKK